MNLTKLTFISCPVVLAALVLVSSPAEAITPVSSLQSNSAESTTDRHTFSVAVGSPSDRPLIPTGCTCARCTRVEELLQGQFLI